MITRFTLSYCAAAAIACLCTVPRRADAQDSVAVAERYAVVAQRLTSLIEHERAQKGIPAISVALVDGQRVVWARGFGWADSAANVRATASTVYRVGSVSKLFTDVAIMRLVERHALDLDAPVQRYLPSFHPTNPFGGEITIRELTSHRAGLTREPPVGNYFDDDSTPAPTLAATVASLNRTTLVYKPGTHTKYSNAGIAVLGYLLEQTQNESFYPYLERTVLQPMGMVHSAFRPLPAVAANLAKGTMWTIDGRRFNAPTFQLGMGPCGSMYSTVLDLGRFVEMLFARGVASNGQRVVSAATLDAMWTPQFAASGAKTGFGIGFNIGQLNGHRTVGHGGAIYGFATQLLALPDDSLGVVVTATLDAANAVTDHIAEAAVRMMLETRDAKPIAIADTTSALPPGRARALIGRYANGTNAVDLDEYEDHLYLAPVRGGSRVELRVPANALDGELMVDDRLSFGRRVRVLDGGRLMLGADTLRRQPTPGFGVIPVAQPTPPTATSEHASLIGEYGWDHDVLYIREKDGKLNALIEWFFEYPLERVSRDVYQFPNSGLYDGQQIVFERTADGKATVAVAGTVRFKRRTLPPDDDRVNFKITPVRPPAELRREALAASPPRESSSLRQPDLVELKSLDSSIKYDIRYATSNNFMGTPFYSSAHAFMQRPAAEAVARASAELRKLGYGLLIHDSYRPWYVTKMFWDGTPPDKHIFVADPSQGSRHNRGAAVDLTLYDLKTGAPIRMTGGYDELTDRSYPLYPGGTTLQRWHRDLLRHAMEAQGFTVYEAEWWHFDFKDWRSYPIGNLTFEQLTTTRK
jgi:CubicO group peptidase (beta-lactamase class C family)/D-alanyl-D-alanine dipeptidase